MTTSSQTRTVSPAAAGLAIAITSALAFGATGPFAKALIDAGWTAGTVVLLRISGAALVLTPIAVRAWLTARAEITRADGRSMLVYGVVAVAGVQLCFFNAVDRLPVSVALLIEYLAPVLMVIGSSVLTRSLPPRLVAAGAVLATVGLIPVLNLQVDGGIDPIGVAWALAAALCLCGYFVLTARSNSAISQPLLFWAGCTVGAIVVALAGAAGLLDLHRGGTSVVLAGAQFSWLIAIAFLVLVCTVLAYTSGMLAIRMMGNRRASFVALTEVLFAAVASWLLLDQTLTLLQAFGAALVITGVVLVQRGAAAPSDPAGPIEDVADVAVDPVAVRA